MTATGFACWRGSIEELGPLSGYQLRAMGEVGPEVHVFLRGGLEKVLLGPQEKPRGLHHRRGAAAGEW